jgi:signal transduction histidine kinase
MPRMRSYASEVFESMGIALEIDFDERLSHHKLIMEKRKNLYLVFKEAVNNIAKYAGATVVSISMQQKNSHVILMIEDNGKGFDTQSAHSGNGLVNMEQRARLLKGQLKITSSNIGTKVELNFPA